jgi:hypothetical protein
MKTDEFATFHSPVCDIGHGFKTRILAKITTLTSLIFFQKILRFEK